MLEVERVWSHGESQGRSTVLSGLESSVQMATLNLRLRASARESGAIGSAGLGLRDRTLGERATRAQAWTRPAAHLFDKARGPRVPRRRRKTVRLCRVVDRGGEPVRGGAGAGRGGGAGVQVRRERSSRQPRRW